LATETNDCAPGEFWKSSLQGAITGAALGCLGSACAASPKLALGGAFTGWMDQMWDCAEQNDEAKEAAKKTADKSKTPPPADSETQKPKKEKTEEKKGEKKKTGDQTTENNPLPQATTLNHDNLVCEDPLPASETDEETTTDASSTPKPDDDDSKGRANASFEDMLALASSARGSLVNPERDNDSPSSISNAGVIDPFNRVKKKRDTITDPLPNSEDTFHGNETLPTGDAWDSLVQPGSHDANTPSPHSPSSSR
jgi:hypothetical protein